MKKRNALSILLISPFFHPHKGGSQRYMEELYAHMAKKHQTIHVDVLAYNTDHTKHKEHYRGMTIHRIPAWSVLPGQFALPNPIALILWLRKHTAYDIVHTHIRFFDATWWAWIFAKSIGAASVFTEHVATHPIHKNSNITLIAAFVDRTIARWSISRYDYITVTNQSARFFLKNTLGISKTIYLTYGGVDTKYFSPKRHIRRTIPHVAKTFGNADTVVSYAGRIIWSKGMTYLYRAIHDSIETLPNRVYFVFAGPGDLQKDIEEEIAKDGLENRIFTTGSLEAGEVQRLLRATDIFIHPSHHNEGFPNVILEAGASENFVIATDNAGVSEIVKDKKTGIMVEQKNELDLKRALRWAVEHPEERRAMAKKLRVHIRRKFEWNWLSERFYTLLKRAKQNYTPNENLSVSLLKTLALS